MSEYVMDEELYDFLEEAKKNLWPLEFHIEGREEPIILRISSLRPHSPFVVVYKVTDTCDEGVINLNKCAMVFNIFEEECI